MALGHDKAAGRFLTQILSLFSNIYVGRVAGGEGNDYVRLSSRP